MSRPWPTRNLAVSSYALTIGLPASSGVEPSQYSCWLSGMNGKLRVAETIRLPGTPWTLALWARYRADCEPVNSRVAWTSAQTYFCTSAGSFLTVLCETATTLRPGMPSLAICSASVSGWPPLAISWASGPAWT